VFRESRFSDVFLHPKMQAQSYKKSTHPARDEWRKNFLLRFLTFGTKWWFCATL
jgi:hypothetical protein